MSAGDIANSWLKNYSFRRLFRTRPSHDEYVLLEELLPSSSSTPPRRQPSRGSRPLRSLNLGLIRTACVWSCYTFVALTLIFAVVILKNGIPPSYDDFRQLERTLPQHNLSLPLPEGSHGKYVRFPGRLTGRGLNNILQEIAFMSHIAYRSNRALAFEEFTWSHSFLPFTIENFELTPSRMPMAAFISGPLVGGDLPPTIPSFGSPIQHPRSISATYHYPTVCPPEKRIYISPEGAPPSGDGKLVMDWWIDRLLAIEDACVEVDANIQPVFHHLMFYSDQILSAWPELSTSPFLTHHSWSPIIQAAVVRNHNLFQNAPLPVLLPSDSPKTDSSKTIVQTFPGLVAMHLRRGDYEAHCQRLARDRREFVAHNQLEGLMDRFFPDIADPDELQPTASSSSSTAENKKPEMTAEERKHHYLPHCWPTIDQIVSRASAVRKDVAATSGVPPLTRVYLMTNGSPDFIRELKRRLLADGWTDVKSTFDLVLDRESRYVSGSVDMAIAEQAQVLIGNGFSTLTSNVVMFRAVKGIPLNTIRFF